MPRREKVYLGLCGLFVGSLLIANIITFKLFSVPLPGDVSLFGQNAVVLAAGVLPYPVTFLVTDLISELYGKRRASAVVWTGFWVSLFVLLVIQVGSWVPAVGTEARTAAEVQALYDGVFGQSSRAIFASMVAYLIAQLFDVRIFHFWKELTRGRHLWLRNNGSTMLSQMLDTVLVVSILFWSVLPFETVVQIIIASYVFKLLSAAVDTPFFYLGVRWIGPWIDERGPPDGSDERDETAAEPAVPAGG